MISWKESAGCYVVESNFGTQPVDGLSQRIGDTGELTLERLIPTVGAE